VDVQEYICASPDSSLIEQRLAALEAKSPR
jgi:hypothetical protein